MTATRVYTDVEVDAIVLTHKNITGAHHTATVSGDIDVNAAKDVNNTAIGDDKILVWKAGASEHVYEEQSGGGVTDHGALTGLADDDHPQYISDAEVDAIVATHTAIAAAHHTKYTDAEVDAIVLTHKNIASAHHTKYTDAEVDAIVATHTAIAAAHHAKYTDAEAVSAVAIEDAYVKLVGDIMSGNLEIAKPADTGANLILKSTTTSGTGVGSTVYFQKFRSGGCILGDYFGFFAMKGETTSGALAYGCYFIAKADGAATATYIPAKLLFAVMQGNGTLWNPGYNSSKQFDMVNGAIKDPKNHAASALSGTKKLVEIDIGGTPYYFEVYPTKA